MTDRVESSRRRITDAGDLVADAVFARIGIQQYTAAEVRAPGRKPHETLNVYRPASEVFKQKTLDSFRSVPVTNDHPRDGLVTSDNVRALRVGMTGDLVTKTDTTIDGTIALTQPDAVSAANGGKNELSAGYTCVYDFTPGTTEDGDPYDAVQRDIVANHVAMVDMGRCGPVCAVADSSNCGGDCESCPGKQRSADMRTVTIDGIGIQLEEGVAKTVNDKLTQLATDAEEAKKKADDMEEEKEKAEGERDAAMAEIKELKEKATDAAAIDKLVEARTQVVSDARRLAPKLEIDGKSNEDIRREVVSDKVGSEAIDGKSDAYIEARFDALAEGGGESERFRQRNLDTQGARDGAKDGKQTTSDAYDRSVVDISERWRGESKSA